jgi:DNA polymerase III delta prime subunit
MITEHFDKNNLHHAYLIEGLRDEIVPEITNFLKKFGINTAGNPDFINISIDNFKIDEALQLRALSSDRSFQAGKKIFIICANTFSLDAQNLLLKMFEEPIENSHFFLIVPDVNALLKTLVSRFYLIKSESAPDAQTAEKFIAMSLKNRIDFIKELLAEPDEEDEEGNEIMALDSTRSKALKFLNALETALHKKFLKNHEWCAHFFKVREFLRMPGSSAKSLMESVALIVPSF